MQNGTSISVYVRSATAELTGSFRPAYSVYHMIECIIYLLKHFEKVMITFIFSKNKSFFYFVFCVHGDSTQLS